MNEQVVNKVISNYAIEQANLRLTVESLAEENAKLRLEVEELKKSKTQEGE